MKILHKYVLKEHLGPLVFSLTALTSLLLLNYLAKRIGDLVGKGLPWSVIAKFFGLSIPFTVALSFPMAVLISTLYAFSRLASENETNALRASGISMRALMTPVLIAALGATIVMVIFNDQIMPASNHTLAKIQEDIARTKPTFALREQVINEIQAGRLYLRANHLDDASNKMREVTIYDLSDASTRRTIYADSGNLEIAPNQTDLIMTLYDGSMQDIPSDNPEQLQRLYFNEDVISIRGVTNQYSQDSTGKSIKGNREMTVCEMHHEVDKLENEFAVAQNRFKKHLQIALEDSIELSTVVSKRDTVPRSKASLGGAYCKFLGLIGLQSWAEPDTLEEEDYWTSIYGNSRNPYGAMRLPTDIYTPQPGLPDVNELGLPDTILYNPFYADSIQKLRESFRPKVDAGMLDTDKLVMEQRKHEIAMYDVEIHKKFALAAACFVFCLLGAPIAIRFPRSGVGLTIGASLIIFALYYIGLIAGSSLASAGKVPAWIALWAANAVFTVIGIYLLSRLGRTESSARGGGLAERFEGWIRRYREWRQR